MSDEAAPAVRRGRSARPQSSAAERRVAEAAAIGVMVIWAGNFIVVKASIGELPPIGFSFLRFLLAGVVLLVICRIVEGGVGVPRREVVPLVALGAIGFGLYQILWTTALVNTTAGNSALLIAATPIFTMLVAVAIGSDTFTRAKAAGAIVSFLGVALVVGAGAGLEFDGRLIGDLMTIAAAFCWACYVSFGAPVLRRHSPLRTTAWTVLAGTAVMAPIGLWQLAGADLATVPPSAGLGILYAGLLAAALGNVVVFRGIKLVGPTRITNYQFLIPALAVLLAAVFLAEPIRPAQVIGGVVIVLGIFVARGRHGARALARAGRWRPA
jgi:drug/metabolite transporter (DMT)-like permease